MITKSPSAVSGDHYCQDLNMRAWDTELAEIWFSVAVSTLCALRPNGIRIF